LLASVILSLAEMQYFYALTLVGIMMILV